MEQKVKFIIIGLAAALAVFLFLLFQTYNANQQLTGERNKLKVSLDEKTEEAKRMDGRIRSLEGERSLLNKQLEEISRLKQDLDSKFDLVNKEKNDLVEKLKKLQQAQAPVQAHGPAQAEFVPQTNDAYWANLLKIKAELEMQLAAVRGDLKSIQLTNEQLQRERPTFELDINSLRREKEDLKRQIDYNQKLMDSIAKDLVREKNDKSLIEDSLKSLKNENSVLTQQLKSLLNHKSKLETKMQGLQEDKASVERRLSEMEAMLSDKSIQINKLKNEIESLRSGKPLDLSAENKNSVELAPILVKPNAAEETPAAPDIGEMQGRVLALNKESNFVVVDLGEEAGIKAGDIMHVYRDNKAVATLEVIQLRKNISACDIKKTNTPLKVGDVVK
ncbi:MAG: hypothetical protein WC628_06810 [Candidatus Omnitrophota bacterium]